MRQINSEIKVEFMCAQPFWKFSVKGPNDYCKVCKHNIYDFRNAGNEDVLKAIKQNGGEVCGTFYKDQFIIDDNTKYGANILGLFLAGSISLLSAIISNAQTNYPESPKTEQHEVKSKTVFDQETKADSLTADCVVHEPTEETAPKKRKRKVLMRIGRTHVACSLRFPFIHVYKIRRGKIKINSNRW
ncbi:MAG: hypothetical protein M3Q58_01390 [Bacteroidota bacterium]|nr:hypothetical protein [Bacteroidota bacterium]